MNKLRGDVVLLDYPFADSSGTKVRPALIVQEDRRNSLLTHTIVAMISKNITRVGTDPTHLLIDISTPDGKASGLHINSAVTCANLYTVHEKHLIKTIGQLSPGLMRQIDDCLRRALDV